MSAFISGLAGDEGVSTDTLRYYERRGLLRPTGRSESGYRLYDESAAERLRFIRAAQRAGLRLADIKELLDVQDRGQCPCGHTQALVGRRLANVRAEIAALEAVEARLGELERRNRACVDREAASWPCAVGFTERG